MQGPATAASAATVYLTREGSVFRMAFPYDKALVERMRALPYASFDRQTKSWTCMVCQGSVEQLRRLYYEGFTDVSVDDLLEPNEELPQVRDAMLRAGSAKRPFVVHMATRDDRLYSRLQSIPGAQWDKSAQAISYPPQAAAALAELANRGVLDDENDLLQPADVVVTFDGRNGRFKILGDERAQPVFDRHFPGKDVVRQWQEKGIDVDFSDAFSQEVYEGELARVSDGVQPDSMILPLYPYQAVDVSFVLSRTGSGVLHQPGVGKTSVAIGAGCELLDRGEVPRVVFICPSSIRTQVSKEIVRFTRFDEDDVVVIGGSKKNRHDAYERAETAKFLVVHYDVLSRDYQLLRPLCAGSFLIFDEAHKCFPAGTMVSTEDGPVDIAEIVESDLRPRVWAYDEESGEFDLRSVTGVMRSETSKPLVEITTTDGVVTCTADHPVYTKERGYVPALSLQSGETLLRLPDHLRATRSEPEVLRRSLQGEGEPEGGAGRVPLLRDAIPHPVTRRGDSTLLRQEVPHPAPVGDRDVPRHAREAEGRTGHTRVSGVRHGVHDDPRRGEQGAPVLRNKLLRGLPVAGVPQPDGATGGTREDLPGAHRNLAARSVSAHAGEQPHGGPRSEGQGVGIAEGTHVPGAGRERNSHRTAASAARGAATAVRDGTGDPNRCGHGAVPFTPDELQGGHRSPAPPVGHRGRRELTPESQVAVPRQEEGGCPGVARVVGVALLEPGRAGTASRRDEGRIHHAGDTGGRRSSEPRPMGGVPHVVYNLEVDGLSNYVADGILVHNCKNPKAKRTKSAKKLAKVSARRVVMTGTPVENDPGEWYSVLGQLAVPGSLGTPHEFFNRYQFPGRFGGYEGARNLPELRQRSAVHYTRRLKSEIAEHLPPLRVQRVMLDPDPSYAAALRRAHREARDEIAKGRVEKAINRSDGVLFGDDVAEAEAGAEMTAVGMLRAMCSSPRLLAMSDSEAAKAMDEAGLIVDTDGPKLDELRSLAIELRWTREQRLERMAEQGRANADASEVTGERMVVFTYSRKMADLIAERLAEDGISHRTYHGGTSQDERDAAVELFTDPDADITALVCTDAAAEGLNLGRCCNLLVNFDVPWNPSTLIQRGNRIHRVDGTASSYLVLNYTVAGTIENGILRMLERKADLSDAILGETGGRAATTGRSGNTSVSTLLAEAFEDLEDSGEHDADGRVAA